MAHILLFLPAMAAVTMLPCPDMLFVIAQSVRGDRKAGIASVFGITVGGIAQVGAAILGLSVLLLRSALAFGVLKYAGAIYLVYLGVATWRARDVQNGGDAALLRARDAFFQGFLTNALNPKVTIFMLAFLPQFVDTRRNVPLQIAMLAGTWYAFAFAVPTTVALTAHQIAARRRAANVSPSSRKIVACILVTLGIIAAIPEKR